MYEKIERKIQLKDIKNILVMNYLYDIIDIQYVYFYANLHNRFLSSYMFDVCHFS